MDQYRNTPLALKHKPDSLKQNCIRAWRGRRVTQLRGPAQSKSQILNLLSQYLLSHWSLSLSLEICKRAGKPSKVLSSHSLSFSLNDQTDFRYWIETSSRKSLRRTSSIPYNKSEEISSNYKCPKVTCAELRGKAPPSLRGQTPCSHCHSSLCRNRIWIFSKVLQYW